MFKNNQFTKKCQIMMERRLSCSIAKKRMNLYEIKELLYRPPFNSFLHFENEDQTSATIKTIKFSKKGLYKGEINDNFLPDGKGILFLENGDIYYGEFNNGIKEGKGKYIYKDLDIYIGDWEEDKKEGHGFFINVKNKWMFEGDFHEDNPIDDGIFYDFTEIDLQEILEDNLKETINIDEIGKDPDKVNHIIWNFFTNRNNSY